MKYMIASSRSTASSFSDLLPQEKLRGLKAAGTYIYSYFPCHVALPRTRLLDHLTFPFYNGYLVLKKTTAVHPTIYSPQHKLQSFSSISLAEPLSTPPLPVIPQEQVYSGRELTREWISLSAHTSMLAWQQQWWHGWGGVPADLFIAEPPSTRSPNAACLPACHWGFSICVYIYHLKPLG